MPTSPHWYDVQRLSRLMAAEIAHAEDNGIPCPTVREFVSSFRGLSATAKAKAIGEAIGASRQPLADFHAGGEERVKALLEAMQASSKPVSRADLWGRFGRGLGLEPQEFDHDAWNAKLAPVASLELQHRDLDADLERAISPFRAIYHGGRVDEFHWPTSLFFGVDFRGTPTGESVPDLVDLAGAARAIAYGPYLHLPSGTWMAVARFAISDIWCRNEIGAEVLMGSEVIASWYSRLPEEGEFELPMVFQVNEPREPVQIRISTLRGAIEGRFQLLHVTVSRVAGL
jgi:hypothetical protein